MKSELCLSLQRKSQDKNNISDIENPIGEPIKADYHYPINNRLPEPQHLYKFKFVKFSVAKS